MEPPVYCNTTEEPDLRFPILNPYTEDSSNVDSESDSASSSNMEIVEEDILETYNRGRGLQNPRYERGIAVSTLARLDQLWGHWERYEDRANGNAITHNLRFCSKVFKDPQGPETMMRRCKPAYFEAFFH